MWILEHEGDLFARKKLWLKPGTRHLLGRTKPTAGERHNHYIQEKSVSRRHLVIAVQETSSGDGYNLHSQSVVELEDSSTIGTFLDNDKFTKSKMTLHKTQHRIRLGNWGEGFSITWQPIVICYNFLSKDFKNGRDPLEPHRARLEPLDIKVTLEFVAGKVTHVVANKRNTPKGLQALVHGRHIVTDDFVDALVLAASPTRNGDEETESRLEIDYEENWPKEIDYLPPVAKEPIPRPASMFAPDPARADIFAGYTFVFCDESQYNQLSGAINGGRGKTLLYSLVPGETAVSDFVRYVKDAAGEKGPGELEDGRGEKGVVVVRHPGAKGFAEWVEDFMHNADLQLNQRSVPQNQFLDIIISKDTKGIRTRLEVDMVESSTAPPQPQPDSRTAPPSTQSNGAASEATRAQKEQTEGPPSKRRSRRAVTVSRFKGFDDFDPSQIPKSQYPDDEPSLPDIIETSATPMDSQEISGLSQAHAGRPSQSKVVERSRKRLTPMDESMDEDMVDSLLPATAALKKRKIDDARAGKRVFGEDNKSASEKGSPASVKQQRKVSGKEVDVLELARSRRKAEEDAARLDAESLQNALQGMDIETMKNVAHVEEMEVPERTDRPVRGDQRGHWDDRWNGRKNFKRFRRQGATAPLRGQKVIVMLEEVQKKDYGITEEYWLESSTANTNRGPRDSQRPSQARIEPDTFENSNQSSIMSRSRPSRRVVVEESQPEPEPEDPGTALSDLTGPRQKQSNRVSASTRHTQTSISQTQTQSRSSRAGTSTAASGVRGKRPADEAPSQAQITKRPRGIAAAAAAAQDSDDSGDELGFKFRRRR